MSTIGTIVDLLGQVPEAIGFVKRIVQRIRDAKPEDRRAIIAAMEAGALHTQEATARAYARLDEAKAARADEPTVPHRINDTGTADPK